MVIMIHRAKACFQSPEVVFVHDACVYALLKAEKFIGRITLLYMSNTVFESP